MRYPRRHGGRLEGRYAEPLVRRHGGGGVAVLAERDGLRRRLQLLAADWLLEVHSGDGGGAAGRDQVRDTDAWRDCDVITHGHNQRVFWRLKPRLWAMRTSDPPAPISLVRLQYPSGCGSSRSPGV